MNHFLGRTIEKLTPLWNLHQQILCDYKIKISATSLEKPLCQAVIAVVLAASQSSTWDDPRFGCSVAGCDCDFDYDDLYDPTLFPGDFEDATFKFGNLNDYDDSNPWVDDDDDYDENDGEEFYVIQSVEK